MEGTDDGATEGACCGAGAMAVIYAIPIHARILRAGFRVLGSYLIACAIGGVLLVAAVAVVRPKIVAKALDPAIYPALRPFKPLGPVAPLACFAMMTVMCGGGGWGVIRVASQIADEITLHGDGAVTVRCGRRIWSASVDDLKLDDRNQGMPSLRRADGPPILCIGSERLRELAATFQAYERNPR